eukprot:356036-Chlamydomonas_euryale.AAC.12
MNLCTSLTPEPVAARLRAPQGRSEGFRAKPVLSWQVRGSSKSRLTAASSHEHALADPRK